MSSGDRGESHNGVRKVPPYDMREPAYKARDPMYGAGRPEAIDRPGEPDPTIDEGAEPGTAAAERAEAFKEAQSAKPTFFAWKRKSSRVDMKIMTISFTLFWLLLVLVLVAAYRLPSGDKLYHLVHGAATLIFYITVPLLLLLLMYAMIRIGDNVTRTVKAMRILSNNLAEMIDELAFEDDDEEREDEDPHRYHRKPYYMDDDW